MTENSKDAEKINRYEYNEVEEPAAIESTEHNDVTEDAEAAVTDSEDTDPENSRQTEAPEMNRAEEKSLKRIFRTVAAPVLALIAIYKAHKAKKKMFVKEFLILRYSRRVHKSELFSFRHYCLDCFGVLNT